MSTVTIVGALVGRDDHMATLVRLMKDVAGGRGSSVLIEGEPGIGKSALVQTALAEAAGFGCQLFCGAGDELGQALPLLPLLDALRAREPSAGPRRATIGRMLRGELGGDRGTDVTAALMEQLMALVADQCQAQPTILVIDDLQWADRASILVWKRLERSVEDRALMLVGVMRPVPQREDLRALRRAMHNTVRLTLTGLRDDAVAELVAALAGGRPDDELLRLADDAAGNPLYITELVAALARSSRLVITDCGAAQLASGPAPASLSAAIADRLGFVSRAVREVLRAAALIGVDFTMRELAIVLARGVADLLRAVDEAVAAGVLTESATGLRFRHPLLRAALYDDIPDAVRAAWHRDAARALAEAGAPADRVARQLQWAVASTELTERMDDWILTWLTNAADILVGQAPDVAAALLRRAVENSSIGSAGHNTLAGRLADALYRLGDTAEAERIAHRALARAVDPDLLVDLHCTLAQCGMRAGRSAESLAALNRALAAPGVSGRHRARLLVLAARMHSSLGEVERAGQVAEDALAIASVTRDRWAMSWALHVLTIVTGVQGNMTDALPLFERALAVTEADPGLTDLRLLLQINKAITLGNLDRHDEAFVAATQARTLADQFGTVVRLAQARSALGQLLFDTGRWDHALTEVQAIHEDLKEPAAACCDLGVAALICFHRGEIKAAQRHLSAALPHAGRLGNRVIPPLALARSLRSELADDLPGALAALTAGFADETEEVQEVEDLFADAVRLAIATGDIAAAKAVARHAAALGAQSEVPRREASALYCQGLIEGDSGLLLRAADRYAEASRPLLSAKALEAAAEAFLGADLRDDARAAFTKAVEIYASLSADTDGARLRTRFWAHGIRRGPRSKHRRARTGWDSLTPTETKIAAHVEAGLSNPEIAARLFLSRRTVATHVSHIIRKLEVHSRTDVAREAALRSLAQR